jgi:hypothetical protein
LCGPQAAIRTGCVEAEAKALQQPPVSVVEFAAGQTGFASCTASAVGSFAVGPPAEPNGVGGGNIRHGFRNREARGGLPEDASVRILQGSGFALRFCCGAAIA